MMELDPRSRDLVIRTVLGEAAEEPDDGMAAVAAVIRNRVASGRFGKSAPEVVLARHQFEPWSTPAGRSRMLGYAQDSEPYQRASRAVDSVFGQGVDPTGGATHFFSPTAQAALGRTAPSWARGDGQPIGRHTFYAPEGRVQMAQNNAGLPPGFELMNDAPQAGGGLPPGFELVQEEPAQFASEPGRSFRGTREGGPIEDLATIQARQATPQQQVATDFANQGVAAGQRTTPMMSAQMPNLISAEVHENDAGMVMFRDPQTGQMVEARDNKHVVLRDPSDNRLKVFGRTANTDEGMLSSAGRLLTTGAAAGAPTARAMIPVRTPVKAPAPTREALVEAADQGYEAARGMGVQFNPQRVGGVAYEIQGGLIGDGFISITAPKTHGILENFRRAVDDAPEGVSASFADLDGIRRALGKVSQGADKTDAAAARIAIRGIDDFVAGAQQGDVFAGDAQKLSQVARDARDNYAAAQRAGRLEKAEEAADLQAATGGSGANIDNAIRQRAKDILKSRKDLAGWSKEEIAELRKVAVGGPVRNASRLLGKLAPTGVVSSALSGGSGFAAFGPAGAIGIPMAGFAFKKLSDTMTMSQMNKVSELVRSRSPLGRQIEASLKAWEPKVQALAENPTAPKIAQFALATRNLALNLKDAGITISPADFIKTMQGGMKAAADDE